MSECPNCKHMAAQRDAALDCVARVNQELRALRTYIEVYVIDRIRKLLGERDGR